MFWSLVLQPNRRYSSIIREPFHLSMATLDIKTVKNDQELFPVLLKIDGKEDSILCNLSKASFPQVGLDLNFEKGTKVGFFTNGSATVHLTGYLIDEDDFDGSGSSEDDSSEASFESTDEAPVNKGQGDMKPESSKKKKRKSEEVLDEVSKKKSKSKSGDEDGSKNGLDMRMKTLNDSKASDSDDDDEEDDDDDDDLSDLDLSDSNLATDGSADLSSNDDDDSDDDEDDEDDDEDEDDDDSDDSEQMKPQKTPQQSPKKKPEEKTPKQGKNVQNQTPSSNKKQGKQNLSLLNGAVTPKSEKKAKSDTPQQKQGGGNKDTPQQKQGGHNKDTPQQKQGGNNKGTPQQQKPGGSPKKQTLAGGVQIEELKTGNGPVAKPGKMVSVYYTGRLKANNRVFDQNNKGPGFKFRLGQGEVVKGYDIGISGMTVGSKRRITIPPNMGYGKKGQQPQIPPNATLVFEVELKSVN